MKHIYLCPKHYTNLYNQILTKDETECKFCLQELGEKMKKFGIVDWKKEMETDRDTFIKTNSDEK